MLDLSLRDINDDYSKSKSKHFIQSIVADPDKDLRDSLYEVLPDGGVIENYPSCSCDEGGLKYEFELGNVCNKCGTEVRNRSEQELDNLLHIDKPTGIKEFLNPKLYIDMVKMCSADKGAFNPIYYYTISSYKPKKETDLYLGIVGLGIPRGWNYFVANMKEILPKIFDVMVRVGTLKSYSRKMVDMITLTNYESNLTKCSVLPVLNSLTLAIERTGDLRRKSPTTELYGLAISNIIELPTPTTNPGYKPNAKQLAKAEDITGNMYRGLLNFFVETIKREGQKEGLMRHDVLGVRAGYSWRCVITQITDPHRGDEIHLPWTNSIEILTPLIAHELNKVGFSGSEILNFIAERKRVYCPDMDKILKDIIKSFGDKGIPGLHIRYPSLYMGSAQLQYITKIKSDPMDRTCSVPALALNAWNGDLYSVTGIKVLPYGNIDVDYSRIAGTPCRDVYTYPNTQ